MIEILILSLVQGITEFLPISSSSHLIIISKYLDFNSQSLSIDVSLHVGSFIAVISYFYKDIINFYENKILLLKILISSIPIMLVGFFLVESSVIEKIRGLEIIAWTTLIFGFLLYIQKNRCSKDIFSIINTNFRCCFNLWIYKYIILKGYYLYNDELSSDFSFIFIFYYNDKIFFKIYK